MLCPKWKPVVSRFAPLYDVASALTYDVYMPKLTMAMRIGGEYKLDSIAGRHWRRFAEAVDVSPARVVERISDLAGRTPGSLAAAVSAFSDSLTSELPRTLTERVVQRVKRCEELLAR